MIYLIAAFILIAQLVLTLQIDDRLVERSRLEINRELTAVFQTTRSAIYRWFEQELENIEFWSEHEDVRRVSRALVLGADLKAESFGRYVDHYQAYLDKVLAPVLERSDVLGYGLLTVEGVVLAIVDATGSLVAEIRDIHADNGGASQPPRVHVGREAPVA